MADTKISALPASTTPLAGTEVLPIVQGGVTRQVSVANLTAGRAVSGSSVTATTGNFVVGTSGQGIDFSATPGTGTSELLADYEEGTFTPIIIGATTPGTGTYSIQVGTYTKIGNRVLFQVYITWSAHTGTGNMRVAGLPFTSSAATDTLHTMSIWSNELALTASNTLQAYVLRNDTAIVLQQVPVGGGGVSNVAIDTAAGLMLSGHYLV
jgi:hypothetical protein